MINLPETYINKRPINDSYLPETAWSTDNLLSFSSATENKDISNKSDITADNEIKSEDKTFNEINKEEKDYFGSQEKRKELGVSEKIKKQKYSNAYIQYEVMQLMNSLQEDFETWKNRGTKNSYAEISNIKNTLENYSEYLEIKDETRVFLGTLELIFLNDTWKDFNETKINFVISELHKFKDGDVDFVSLEKFHKQLWQSKIFS